MHFSTFDSASETHDALWSLALVAQECLRMLLGRNNDHCREHPPALVTTNAMPERRGAEGDAQRGRRSATRLMLVKPSPIQQCRRLADPFQEHPRLASIRCASAGWSMIRSPATAGGRHTGANLEGTTAARMACAANGHYGHLSAWSKSPAESASGALFGSIRCCNAPQKIMLISCVKPRHSGN